MVAIMEIMHAINKVSHQNKLGMVSWVQENCWAGCRTMTIAQGSELDGPHFAFYLFSINPRSQVYLFNWPPLRQTIISSIFVFICSTSSYEGANATPRYVALFTCFTCRQKAIIHASYANPSLSSLYIFTAILKEFLVLYSKSTV